MQHLLIFILKRNDIKIYIEKIIAFINLTINTIFQENKNEKIIEQRRKKEREESIKYQVQKQRSIYDSKRVYTHGRRKLWQVVFQMESIG